MGVQWGEGGGVYAEGPVNCDPRSRIWNRYGKGPLISGKKRGWEVNQVYNKPHVHHYAYHSRS